MNILGISALYHDSAAALIKNGEIIAAAQEERFSRVKHDARIPANAIKYCLAEGKISSKDLDYIAFYDNPLLTLDRYTQNVLALGDKAMDLIASGFNAMFSQRLWAHKLIRAALGENTNAKFVVCKHHISHASSAFFPSPFEKAMILTLDGVGEWTTLSVGRGENNKIALDEEIRYPHSLGLLYSAFTYFCGFKVNSGDYKFMGLAPYGEPIYYDILKERIIDIKDDGSFRLNLKYFDYQNGRTMINEGELAKLFNGGKREQESRITKREMDIAASVQKVTEEVILKIVSYMQKKYADFEGVNNLVMAGGVALNCVANGKVLRESGVKNLWIQPAAGDAGGALGAALYTHYQHLDNPRNADGVHDKQRGSFLGVGFTTDEIKKFLEDGGYKYHLAENAPAEIAKLLDEQKIIGLFNGRMEFGPRALGHRSIIADPRSKDMQSRLNLKIKFRESFRPFAPSVLKERISDYFELDTDSPYMLLCADVAKNRRVLDFDVKEELQKSNSDMLSVVNQRRSDIPAVTHVDYSARVQSVDREVNPYYYDIIKAFETLTGCGVIVNTSFNVRGEPIVCSPEDAYRCFMRSDMDVLALENFILFKEEQPKWEEAGDWRAEYELD